MISSPRHSRPISRNARLFIASRSQSRRLARSSSTEPALEPREPQRGFFARFAGIGEGENAHRAGFTCAGPSGVRPATRVAGGWRSRGSRDTS